MGLFDKILESLGMKKKPEAVLPPTAATAGPSTHIFQQTTSSAPKPVVQDSKPVSVTKPLAEPVEKVQRDSRPVPENILKAAQAPEPMAMVDVKSKLEKLAKDNGGNLDWKASIVDLLKLLKIDSSLEARKELAVELGCPPEKMKESQNMNIWLHKTVLAKIAENGGNIPKELLD